MADDYKQDLNGQAPDAGDVVETQADEDLAARVASLEEQLATAQDQLLRAAADVQNARRRAEQDVEKAHKFALERFAGDLLPILDSLERGMELSDPNDPAIKPMREGIELTLKMFTDTLGRFQVQAVEPHGEPFNPELHQAMAMEESAAVEPNTVLKVFQKGYTLSGRLLRPAMVVVSKTPSDKPAAPQIDEQA
ncbi:nucleotide exchange factor GrpE [Halopseudomonas phragmitis]|uniref:Protein GrpE n=2 Tax=Pseudomonadaceae TaxID=135621 RepID=A0A1V0B125_9GAMM|nr:MULTISPECIES: nucleotide exchange factor GrpE [Pseudomonadaceae]AQZ93638.1 nucleotide exchange factor GrpE [Halopseudomonas phragmitis]PAU86262.1 nucleotide exchange factor GrpE [Pseudomonas sp. WN033]RHW20295.1 nucleotide exchange factor GrpE [Pseudomonas jilinensis]